MKTHKRTTSQTDLTHKQLPKPERPSIQCSVITRKCENEERVRPHGVVKRQTVLSYWVAVLLFFLSSSLRLRIAPEEKP